jgi:hypothetical protein
MPAATAVNRAFTNPRKRQKSLKALRDADHLSDIQLRNVAFDHWIARSVSAWELGQFKYMWLKRAALALLVPLLFLVVVGAALLR